MANSDAEVPSNDHDKNDLDQISDEDLRRAVLSRKIKKGIKWSWKEYIIIVVVLYVLSVIGLFALADVKDAAGRTIYDNIELKWIVLGVSLAVPLFTALMQSYAILLQKLMLTVSAAAIGVAKASDKASELQDSLGDDFVTNLVKINFKYIDQYYLQTQQQADRSFSLSMWASVAGFAVVLIGVALAIFNGGPSAYIATGAGLISEFIAAVFFYLYNQTILSMGNYHRKLVITQNIALALKISDDLPDMHKADVQAGLVKTLTADVNNLLTLEGVSHKPKE